MENLEPYFDKFSESGARVLKNALAETRRRNQHFISPEHILHALMTEETDSFDAAMRKLSIAPRDIRTAVEKRLENSPTHAGEGFRIAPETTEIFKYSMDYARSQNRRRIEANDILYTLTTNKFDLLNDILQNPEGAVRAPDTGSIDAADNQSRFLSRLKIKPSNFLIDFSLVELVKKSAFPAASSGAANRGGIGGWASGGDSEAAAHNKHETFHCPIKPEDSGKFDEREFIFSLRKNVEESINRNGLKITKSDGLNSSAFQIEYEAEQVKGRIEISGEMKKGYYELKALAAEESSRKTKYSNV
jgi:hypothetical protein